MPEQERMARAASKLRIAVLAALLIASASPVAAQSPTVEKVEIIQFGLYHVDRDGLEPGPDTPLGRINTVTRYALVTQTNTVCARIGVSFGVEYNVVGKPDGALVALDKMTQFPPQGLVDPSGRKFLHSKFSRQRIIGSTSFRSYTFEEDWEIELGPWTLEFHYQGRKIGEKRFNVVACSPTSSIENLRSKS
jgi:Domain of unknown function (DUF3859)